MLRDYYTSSVFFKHAHVKQCKGWWEPRALPATEEQREVCRRQASRWSSSTHL